MRRWSGRATNARRSCAVHHTETEPLRGRTGCGSSHSHMPADPVVRGQVRRRRRPASATGRVSARRCATNSVTLTRTCPVPVASVVPPAGPGCHGVVQMVRGMVCRLRWSG
ncbi:hypothetical protein EAO77_30180 [Streptomyces sp. t39]|nr:hypothetical protein EAO77_30180 [Streptomyces sp. t39]